MSKTRDSNAIWEREYKMIFCDLCIREVELGNRPTTHFNKEGWSNLITGFKEKTGREYNKIQLKNKWDQIKKDWKLWKELKMGATGLGWCPIRKTIDASDSWWKEKLEVFPRAKKFRNSGIDPELEDKLDQMFTGVVAMGAHACAPSMEAINSVNEVDVAVSIGSSDDCLPDVAAAADTTAPSSSKVKSVSKRKRSSTNYLKEGISSLLSTLASSDRSHHRTTSIFEAMKILRSIPEIHNDKAMYMKATNVLENSAKRDIFLALEPELRSGYIRFQITGVLDEDI